MRPRLRRGRARRADPGRVELLRADARRRPQRDARARPPRAPGGDEGDADPRRADDGPRHDRRSAARAAEHARRRARAVRPRPADRARRQPVRHRRVHRRRADPGAVPLPGRTVGVHGQPDRQDRLLPGRLRRPLRPLHRAASSTSRIKSDVGRTLHGAVDINLRDSSAYVEGPVPGGVRTSFAVRRSYIDALLPLVLPYFVPPRSGSTFFTVAPVYWDYQARADKDLPGGGRVALIAFGSSDSLEIISGDPTVELASNTHIGFHHVMGEWVTALGEWNIAPVGDVRLRRSEPVDRRLRRLPALPPPVGPRGHQPALQPDARAVGGAGLRPQLRLGALRRPALPARGPHASARRCRRRGRRRTLALRHGAGAVREAQLNVTPRLRVVPGLRFDYYHVVETDKFSCDPRLALRWDLTPRLALKAAVGIYHQLPNPEFLDRSSATRTCCCRGPTSTRSASNGDSPRLTS